MTSLETTIRAHLTAYLANAESFADFTAWMYRTILNIDQYGEPAASDLGYAVMLALAEFDSGVLTLAEFRQELSALNAGIPAPFGAARSSAAD
ncbi:MAG: hypothetical protein QM692_24715 [Thermomicrobiales bacterium]